MLLEQPDALATLLSLPSLEDAAFSLEMGEEMEMPITLEVGQSKNPPRILCFLINRNLFLAVWRLKVQDQSSGRFGVW